MPAKDHLHTCRNESGVRETGEPASEVGVPTVAALRTRGFAIHPGLAMAAAGAVGLLTVTAAATAGLHPFVSVGLLLAVTVAVLMRLAGDATVRLTDAGIERTVSPLMARLVALPDRHQYIGFGDIRAYRRDSDRSRFRGEVAYLTLSLRRPPFRVTIHDMGGKTAFEAFADAFEALAARYNIRRRHGFYQTAMAKVLTLAFAVAALAVAAFAVNGSLSPLNLFRLWAIIIPGTMYMTYRVVTARPRPS